MSTITIDHNLFQLTQELNTIPQTHYQVKTLKKGEHIYFRGDKSNKIFFLKKGRVTIASMSQGGKIKVKNIVQPGVFFGEMGLIGEKHHKDFAVAKEDSLIWTMDLNNFHLLLKRRPDLYMYLIRSMGQRLQKTERRLENMIFKNSRKRIIDFLHNLGVEQGQSIGYETLVRTFFTHQEIADLTGTSRQTVTTTLNDLRNANILTFNRRRLLIRDLSRLGHTN